ncbi:hypothetical protein EX895_005633 [Sporisorium graminicola]|uniref:Uncharacterized protein n=1 Tax=Sporisorium graminicola TaxID=280036 RepID=A0A4U7KMH4_9BASI|nr:hypothetical protein EX895_005633 [Sporisorium graminicola]TKY85471.1 hypothetical protein EX895_005633 [Sporisorium graminicola]
MRIITLALCSSLVIAAASAHISTLNAASSSSGSALLARSEAVASSARVSSLGLQKRAETEDVVVDEVDEGDDDSDYEDEEEEVVEEVDVLEARAKKHKKAHHRSAKHSGGRRTHKKHHHKKPKRPSHPSHKKEKTHKAYTTGTFQGKGTFFDPDQGACGEWNTGADKIVALSSDIYQGGAHCFERVNICHAGKCVKAKVADLCPGCKHTSLDMSPSLFRELASPDLGVIDIQWSFV